MKLTPFWWETAPPATLERPELPSRADAVIVGSGYTGLHAALVLARAGRDVVVLEAADRPGEGCSTRNGGQVSTSIKPGLATLTRRHGAETARGILAEGRASRTFIEEFVTREEIACDFRVSGRFHGAATPRAFAALVRTADGERVTAVPRDRQREELGTDRYSGGVVQRDHASLDPARYHAGLLALVRAAGARLHPQTAALSLDEGASEVRVTTPHGVIAARDVLLATNGYTGPASPWHRRRIVPVGSYMIATEAQDPELMRRLFPTGRIASDTRRVVFYYRASPDGRRVLFGGRTSAGEADLRPAARRLRLAMSEIFPELAKVGVTHAWMGLVGYTFDTLPHCGARGRVHHAMGYCGSGVGMASYLGMKAGLRILGDPAGETALMRPDFATRPLYGGDPWFLPAVVSVYRALDRFGL